MTNRPPLPGTYDPKDWKCPSCKTLNFKKRSSCLSCATSKPREKREAEKVMQDWRTGKKDCGANTFADWTCRICGKFNLAAQRDCEKCGKPNPQAEPAALLQKDAEDGRTGRSAGHFDRDPEEERNAWNSDDEEFDEFGRKKRRTRVGSVAAVSEGKKAAGMSEKQRAALERLKAKTAPAGEATSRGRSRSRSRCRSRRLDSAV
eukprot:TRINITY_DN12231_c0_g1_i1.p1 TRINITY_DN12231_c0_g1~~TRINITY_DN12231_c0_g1_i1.p1  ORF type:complete len:204 (-),score=39.46 TRINITY_DN12231_c0_g1_i1:65-676(-)